MSDPRETAESSPGNPPPGSELQVGAPVRVTKLDGLKAVRAELGRLYREARRREGRYPDALTAQRLAHVLGAIRSAIELDEVKARLLALEERAATGQQFNGPRR